MRRVLAVFLLTSLLPVSAFADLRASIAEQAVRAAAQQTSATQRINPYKVPALGLMAGGAGLLVVGLLQDRGAEVSTSGTSVAVRETGGSKTALMTLGVGAGAGGALLWFLGENRKNAAPSVWWSGSAAGVRHSIKF